MSLKLTATICRLLRDFMELPIGRLYSKLRVLGFRNEEEIAKTLKALHTEGQIIIHQARVRLNTSREDLA